VNPPVPEPWWPIIRETMPAFDCDLTPIRGVGVIPETFRKQRGVERSYHPQMSFAAWGAGARRVTMGHELHFGLGEGSPLARIYEMGGWVLLLGVSHQNNTSLHLAEYRASAAGHRIVEQGAPVLLDGERQWATLQDVDLDDSDFETIGDAFVLSGTGVRQGSVAGASALLLPQRPLVDFAVRWMEKHRGYGTAA